MYIIYNFLVLCVCCLFVLPYFLYRCICEAGFTTRMRQSLGGLRDEEIASVAQKDCIWTVSYTHLTLPTNSLV